MDDLCDCGRVSIRRCSDVQPEGITLVRCQKFICSSTVHGGWCDAHRHEPGTMGFMANARITFDYLGEDAEGEEFWQWLVAHWRNAFWSSDRLANHVWQKFKAAELAPPIPIPTDVKIRVRGFRYELKGDRMVKCG